MNPQHLLLLFAISTAAFDASRYPRSHKLHPNLTVYWEINAPPQSSIRLAVQVVTTNLLSNNIDDNSYSLNVDDAGRLMPWDG
jgi:hypothetical protein